MPRRMLLNGITLVASLLFLAACEDYGTEPSVPASAEVNPSAAFSFYPNPDLSMTGSAYSSISPGVAPPYAGECPWWEGTTVVIAAWDTPGCEFFHGITPWVEYTATLSPGRWSIGLNAANYRFLSGDPGLGPDPAWYPEFQIANNLTDDIIRIPASDTEWMHGYVYHLVWTSGPFTVRFWWLNDAYEGPGLRDANLMIRSAFFDQVTELVGLDIKPGSCPNTINAGDRGVISVALLGSPSFDVTTVDPASAWMGDGVAPLRWSIEDVATPWGSMPEDALDCTELGPDGYLDLNFKFDLEELVASDGDQPADGYVGLASLIARLQAAYGGGMVEGADIVRIVGKNLKG